MNIQFSKSLVMVALLVTSLSGYQRAFAEANGTASPLPPLRDKPLYLACGTVDGQIKCWPDPTAQWLKGGTPKPVRIGGLRYPSRFLDRGLSGDVVAQFTVTEEGRVRNAVVLESQPLGVFDDIALQAIKGFRYSPPIVAGRPGVVPGVSVRIVFDIDQGQSAGRSAGAAQGTVSVSLLPL